MSIIHLHTHDTLGGRVLKFMRDFMEAGPGYPVEVRCGERQVVDGMDTIPARSLCFTINDNHHPFEIGEIKTIIEKMKLGAETLPDQATVFLAMADLLERALDAPIAQVN